MQSGGERKQLPFKGILLVACIFCLIRAKPSQIYKRCDPRVLKLQAGENTTVYSNSIVAALLASRLSNHGILNVINYK